jgi:hypothetical protein
MCLALRSPHMLSQTMLYNPRQNHCPHIFLLFFHNQIFSREFLWRERENKKWKLNMIFHAATELKPYYLLKSFFWQRICSCTNRIVMSGQWWLRYFLDAQYSDFEQSLKVELCRMKKKQVPGSWHYGFMETQRMENAKGNPMEHFKLKS